MNPEEKELMMNDFCVMFERATRDIEPICWEERLEDFIDNLLKTRNKEYEQKIDSLFRTRQEKMVDIINRLEIVAKPEDNPTNKEKAELVKEIWELWIKPVVIQNLIKV